MKNIAIIVPLSLGTKTKNRVAKLLRELLDMHQFSPIVVVREYAGHATQLAQQFALEGYYAVVAVGGDDLVNEIACGLIGSQTALGIIPYGKWNRLANHLDISPRMNRAIEMLNHSEAIYMDYGLVNQIPFFVNCGVGGAGWEAESYMLTNENITKHAKAILIQFSNVGQWSYAAYTSPKSSIQDGWLDMTIIDENSNISETIQTKEIHLCREQAGSVDIDGFVVTIPKEMDITIVEDELKVLVKKRF